MAVAVAEAAISNPFVAANPGSVACSAAAVRRPIRVARETNATMPAVVAPVVWAAGSRWVNSSNSTVAAGVETGIVRAVVREAVSAAPAVARVPQAFSRVVPVEPALPRS
jgi:hypothetical protein